MRLINADTAEKKLAELVELYEKRMPNWSPNDMLTSGRDAAFKWGFKADGAEKALEIIKKMPTVDVEPVRHGEWIKTDVCENQFKCSECGKTVTTNTSIIDPADFEFYCYNCGAKMDGDADND